MEKTLAEKRPAWKTRKTAFPTFPQLRLRVYYKSKSTTKTKPSYDPVCGQWGQVTLCSSVGSARRYYPRTRRTFTATDQLKVCHPDRREGRAVPASISKSRLYIVLLYYTA